MNTDSEFQVRVWVADLPTLRPTIILKDQDNDDEQFDAAYRLACEAQQEANNLMSAAFKTMTLICESQKALIEALRNSN